MSKQNNVNPGQYNDGSRLKTDDRARERMKQEEQARSHDETPKDRRRPDDREHARGCDRGGTRD